METFAFLANSSVYILKFHKVAVYFTSYKTYRAYGTYNKKFQ